ncbi:MAG: relaxase/mobilization nuclease RlxS [Rhizomicrobium sp.]
MRDDDFEPRPGKIGNRQSKRGRSYLQRVLHASVLAGPRSAARAFTGSRMGRGSGIGRMLSTRDRYAALRSRRVIIKSRIVKLAGKGLAAAKAHLRYIQRDGVTRDGQPGQLYDAERVGADGKAFLERGAGDRHQFRFIVSAEDGAEYEDLKPFVRRLMAQMETDLGTKLDWVAVDHFNTGHPHTHVMLRGKDNKGEDLIIARDYISQGMRERAAEIVAFDLGPRPDHEIEARLSNEVEQDRFTSLDRSLLRLTNDEGILDASSGRGSPLERTLLVARLQKLARLELADEIETGRWRLAPNMEDVLRRIGERGDIIKTLQHALQAHGVALDPSQLSVQDAGVSQRLVGEVVARGLSDEINDRSYLVLNGTDGRAHYVDIGRADEAAEIRRGMLVAIEPTHGGIRDVDRTVAQIAADNAGRYSVDHHLRSDPSASVEFAQAHVRRLEAMRRAGGFAIREKDGSWQIGPDHLAKVEAYEHDRARLVPVRIETLSRAPLVQQIGADGVTWLDKQIVAREPEAVTTIGFGREVRDALQRRRQWLMAEDLARQDNGAFTVRADLLASLQRRELTRVAGQLSAELGLMYSETKPGDRIEGVYRRAVDLASGRFALIEKARDFTLVPWRPVLERRLGQTVSGISRGETISWTLGRQRGGPAIE